MLKTVIGSWPVFFSEHDKEAIKISIKDQVEAGIDIVSDGQTRNYMVEYFSNLIEGFNCQICPIDFCNKDCGVGPQVIDKITYETVHDDTVIGDLEYALEISPLPVKGIITGPTTLVNCSKLETDEYESLYDKQLFKDLSKALVKIANDMLRIGVHSIQIDEPFISVGSPTHLAKYSLEYMCKKIDSDISLHVCGDVNKEIFDTVKEDERKIFDIIMGFKGISSTSFSFKGYPQNKLCIAQYINSAPPKKIGLGCVRTDSEDVESVKEVYDLLRFGTYCLGEENVIAVPDCGMKILTRDLARQKLQVMCQAADDLQDALDKEKRI